MAVAVDTVSTDTGTASPLTTTHNPGGTNRFMLALISGHEPGVASPIEVTSITFGAATFSKVGTVENGTVVRVEVWKLDSEPATGADTVTVNFANITRAAVTIITFTGVNQTTPLGTLATATGSSTAASVSVTSATDELVVDAASSHRNPSVALTVDGSQTERSNLVVTRLTLGTSTEAGAASVSMDWTVAPSNAWAIAGVSVKPAAVVTGNPWHVYAQQ